MDGGKTNILRSSPQNPDKIADRTASSTSNKK